MHDPSRPTYTPDELIARQDQEKGFNASLGLHLPAKGGVAPIPKPFEAMSRQ